MNQATSVPFLPRVLLSLNLEKCKTVDSHSRFYINSEMGIACSTNNIPSIKRLICLAVINFGTCNNLNMKFVHSSLKRIRKHKDGEGWSDGVVKHRRSEAASRAGVRLGHG